MWMTLENEERFINKYSKRGYLLKYIAPFRLMPPLEFRVYKFNVSKENNNIYKIDNRTFKNETDEQEYMQLMRDDGWHFFENNYTFNNWYRNYYWYRERVSGDEDIYSDEESKLEANNRMFSHLLMFAVLLLLFSAIFPISNTNTANSRQTIVGMILSNWYILGLLLITTISLIGKIVIFFRRKKISSI
jgi:hypothetical protein